MENEIDRLSITIDAEAQKANTAIDLLADKLDRLYTSLGRIDGTRLHSLANGVSQLSTAVKGIASIDGRTFTALANNINKIANINSSGIGNSATAITNVANSFSQLGNASQASQNMSTLVSAISKLGNKSVVTATSNIPQLAAALNQLMVTLSKAPTVNKSVIDMTNALANLASQGSKVGSASNSIVNGLNRTNAAAKRTASSTKSLAAAFGKFYANYFLLVRGFKALFGSMESAMELTETVNYFNVTLNNIGESARENWKKYGYESADAYAESFAQRLRESNEKLTGFTVDEAGKITQSQFSGLGISPAMATQYSAMFAQVANSIGMTEEASVALSEAFVRLGADWASLRNVDFETAYEKLGSALSGQSRALRAFGVDITQATLQETAFNNGIEKSVSEMTQAEKSYLRLIAIIEQSEVAFGDLANTLESPSNQIRMLQQGLSNLATLIGNLFMPILQKALPILNGFVIALQRIIIAISEAMGIDTSAYNTSLGGMSEGFEGLTDDIDDATESAKAFNKATRGWDELNVLSSANNKPYGVGNDSITENLELNDAFFKAIEKYRKAWDEAYKKIENKAEDFADNLLGSIDLKKISNNVADFAESISVLYDAVAPFVLGGAAGFASTSFGFLKTFLDFFAGVFGIIDAEDAFKVGEAIGKIAANLLLFKGVTSALTGITNAANGLKLLGTTLATNPILTVAGIGAVVATNLAGIIGSYTEEAFGVDYVDGIQELSEEIDRQTQSFKERAEAAEKIASQDSELEIIYGKWKDIANKVGELSDEDKGLLKAYADRIKELLPEAADLIGANGEAYAGAAEQLDALITKQLELYRVQAAEQYVKDIMQIEIEMEYNLKDLNKQRDKIFEEIVKEFAPGIDLTKNPLYGFLPEVAFQNEVLEDIKEMYQKRLQSFDGTLFNMDKIKEAKSEYESVVKNIEEYQDILQSISKQEGEYENIQSQLADAVKGLTEAQKDYNGAVDSSNKSSESQVEHLEDLRTEIDNSVSAMYKIESGTKDATTQMSNFVDASLEAEKAVNSFNESLSSISSMKLSLPLLDDLEKLHNKIVSGGLPTVSEIKTSSSYSFEDDLRRIAKDILSTNNNNVNVQFQVEGDPYGLFNVVQKQANQYTKSTGRNAFGY